jgi:hypothetical protein
MNMDKILALKALKLLDEAITENHLPLVKLVVGGGTSMLLAHGFPGKTNDVAAAPISATNFEDLKVLAEKVAKILKLDHDWLNPYFQAYTIYLPADAKNRYARIYDGKNLIVEALGAEDVLIMKLMAGRAKDHAHIRHLLKMELTLKIVEQRLEELKKLYPKESQKALDLLDEYQEDS